MAPVVPVVLPEVKADELGDSPSSPVSSSTSSSACDISAEGVDLVGVLADQTAVEDMSWLQQGKKIHLIREEAKVKGHCRGAGTSPLCRSLRDVAEVLPSRSSRLSASGAWQGCQEGSM